jgi:hypothetical protein
MQLQETKIPQEVRLLLEVQAEQFLHQEALEVEVLVEAQAEVVDLEAEVEEAEEVNFNTGYISLFLV